MNLQLRWDLYHAQRNEAEQIKEIQPHALVDASDGAVNPSYIVHVMVSSSRMPRRPNNADTPSLPNPGSTPLP